MLQNYLELTPDQRKAMAEVDAKYAKTRPELRENLWKAGDELIAVLLAGRQSRPGESADSDERRPHKKFAAPGI